MRMLTITDSAKDKLRDDLQREKSEETLLRIAGSSSDPRQIGLFLDKEKEGDQVIADKEGERLLLIDQGMAHILTGLTFDYVNTDQGMHFTLTAPNP
jgi:Fe-S cluster assembly iron-binding protein IscA